ncbi:cuticle protein LPCP-23 [Drosophila bipectinata]|uniref:cuticle protein LPCP-23 n=1 Tax=Drosophila bipectinata TaxID=42026 RepID=UPI001C892AF0|nr:cuticle protein LPCP-23 [Drosophila bipectinata]
MSQIISLAASLLLLLAPTWAGIIAQPISYLGTGDEHAVAHTQQNVVRSFDGTVSHYAKSVATPYSQVHKQDTRISNNVYQPTVAKTFSYAPAPAPVAVHAEPSNLFTQATPVAPVYQQSAHYQAPDVYHQPAHVQAPAVYHHPAHVEAPSVYHQPAHIPSTVVAHQPAVIHYSPAETVSHMSFDGFGTHYGF